MDKIKNIVNIFKILCYKYDSTWITRNRKLNTYILFCYLSNSLINQKTFNETILDFTPLKLSDEHFLYLLLY